LDFDDTDRSWSALDDYDKVKALRPDLTSEACAVLVLCDYVLGMQEALGELSETFSRLLTQVIQSPKRPRHESLN